MLAAYNLTILQTYKLLSSRIKFHERNAYSLLSDYIKIDAIYINLLKY